MFTGVGGFELGLERANDRLCSKIRQEGFPSNKQEGNSSECSSEKRHSQSFRAVGVSEIDKYSNELLKNKWPNIKNYGDATTINPEELPDFDMLCGGFPCQAFSIAGKRRGFKDTRGTLFFDIARIIEVKRPKIVFLENVKGLLNHEQGKTFRKIIQTLSELGYNVQWMVLNSKFFGVPQNRERVFIIGSLRGEPRPKILPFREKCKKNNELQGQQTNTLKARYNAIGDGSYIIKSKLNAQAVITPDRKTIRQNGRRFKEPSFTITGQDVPGVAIMDLYNNKEHTDRSPALTEPHHNTLRVRDGMKIRKLTPLECERLQGFPYGWTEGFSDNQRYKMIGNAVTVNVIKAIGERLINTLSSS